MTLLLLEALAAGLIFVFIIWWTMFSGRRGGELPPEQATGDETPKEMPTQMPKDTDQK
jgi:hypothetical protein